MPNGLPFLPSFPERGGGDSHLPFLPLLEREIWKAARISAAGRPSEQPPQQATQSRLLIQPQQKLIKESSEASGVPCSWGRLMTAMPFPYANDPEAFNEGGGAFEPIETGDGPEL